MVTQQTATDEAKVINYSYGQNPQDAVISAKIKSQKAVDDNPDFFHSDEHAERVLAVRKICLAVFGREVNYINQRGGGNGHRPFTVLKVVSPNWPRSIAQKRREFNAPIEALGNVERVSSVTTNSLLIRIY